MVDDNDDDVAVTMPPLVERIYVGGLAPERGLGVRELRARLERVAGVEILSVDDGTRNGTDDARTFLFADVRRTTHHHQYKTARDVVASQYHNVRWKGCRLSVEAARPHVLERLRQEREAATESKAALAAAVAARIQTAEEKKPAHIPRQLRIRRRHGEEAFHVDTRPRRVEDARRFADYFRNARKIEHRMEWEKKRRMSGVAMVAEDIDKTTRHNKKRSVHLRFGDIINNDDDDVADDVTNTQRRTTTNNTKRNDKDDASSDSSSSADESGAVDNTTKAQTNVQSKYVWSSSEDESSDDEDSVVSNKQTSSVNPATAAAILDSTGKFDDGNANKNVVNTDNMISTAVSDSGGDDNTDDDDMECQEFVWSTDGDDNDDSSDDDKNSTHDFTTVPAENTPQVSEKEEDESSKDSETDDENDSVKEVDMNDNTGIDLSDDVAANLSVLSTLFPDVNTKPMLNAKAQEQVSESVKSDTTTPKMAMTMQRFDPTSTTSVEKYEIKTTNETTNQEEASTEEIDTAKDDDDGTSENGNDAVDDEEASSHSNSSNKTVTTTTNNDAPQTHVYEQSKLEHIFQQARGENPATCFKFSLLGDNDTNDDMEVDADSKGAAKDDGAFSFGFALGGDDDDKVDDEPTVKEVRRPPPASAYGFDLAVRHRGLGCFNDNDALLRPLVAGFYEFHKTATDATNEEAWSEERQRLTLDWRRKEKLAASKRQQKKTRYW